MSLKKNLSNFAIFWKNLFYNHIKWFFLWFWISKNETFIKLSAISYNILLLAALYVMRMFFTLLESCILDLSTLKHIQKIIIYKKIVEKLFWMCNYFYLQIDLRYTFNSAQDYTNLDESIMQNPFFGHRESH